MAVSYVSNAGPDECDNTSPRNLSISVPGTVADGDLILLFHSYYWTVPPTSPWYPTGFTEHPSSPWLACDTSAARQLAYKIASSESGSWTTQNFPPDDAQMFAVVLRGANQADPFDDFTHVCDTGVDDESFSAVTISNDGSFVVVAGVSANEDLGTGWTVDMISPNEFGNEMSNSYYDGTNRAGFYVASAAFDAGAEGGWTVSRGWTSIRDKSMFSIVIAPAVTTRRVMVRMP